VFWPENAITILVGCDCSSSLSLPTLSEKVFWSKMGTLGEERCKKAEVDVGFNKCENSSLP